MKRNSWQTATTSCTTHTSDTNDTNDASDMSDMSDTDGYESSYCVDVSGFVALSQVR